MFDGLSILANKWHIKLLLTGAALLLAKQVEAADLTVSGTFKSGPDPLPKDKTVEIHATLNAQNQVFKGRTDDEGYFETILGGAIADALSGTTPSIPFPNPSSGESEINVPVAKPGDLSIKKYNTGGQKVEDLSYRVPVGNHVFHTTSGDHANGIYFYRILYPDGKVFIRKTTFLGHNNSSSHLDIHESVLSNASIDSIVVFGQGMSRFVYKGNFSNIQNGKLDLKTIDVNPAYLDVSLAGVVLDQSSKPVSGNISLKGLRGDKYFELAGKMVNGQYAFDIPVGSQKIVDTDLLKFIEAKIAGEYVAQQTVTLTVTAVRINNTAPTLVVNKIAEKATVSGVILDQYGNPLNARGKLFVTKNGKPDSVEATSSNGNINFIYPISASDVIPGFTTSIDSAKFSADYALLKKLLINSPYGDKNLGNVILTTVPRSINVSGNTKDVFGEDLVADMQGTFYVNVNGKIDSSKAFFSGPRFSIIYQLDKSKVIPGFLASADSVVFEGSNVSNQRVNLADKRFADQNIGDVVLDALRPFQFNVIKIFGENVETYGWRDRLPVSNADVFFIGKNDTTFFKADENGMVSGVLFIGDYDVDVFRKGLIIDRGKRTRILSGPNIIDDYPITIANQTETLNGMTEKEMNLLTFARRWATPPITYIDTTNYSADIPSIVQRGWLDLYNRRWENNTKPLFITPIYPEGFFKDAKIEIGNNRPGRYPNDPFRIVGVPGYVPVFFFNRNNPSIGGGTPSNIGNGGPEDRFIWASTFFNTQIPDSGFYKDARQIGFYDVANHETSAWAFLPKRFFYDDEFVGGIKSIALEGVYLMYFEINTPQPADKKIALIVYTRDVGYMPLKINGVYKDRDPDYGKPKIGSSKKYSSRSQAREAE